MKTKGEIAAYLLIRQDYRICLENIDFNPVHFVARPKKISIGPVTQGVGKNWDSTLQIISVLSPV